MQRWYSKFRSVAATVVRSQSSFHKPLINQQRLFHSSINKTLIISSSPFPCSFAAAATASPSIFSHLITTPRTSSLPVLTGQVRHLTLKQRKRKLKCRQPPSPIVSKLKKYKIKPYSSFKGRFRTMKDGQIRRWKEGKRHNAHLKVCGQSKTSKPVKFCGKRFRAVSSNGDECQIVAVDNSPSI